MTEKQMISTLKGLTFGTVVGSKGVEALEMAIQALSQGPICDRDCEHCTWTECPIEPCDDAISREDATAEFIKWQTEVAYAFGRDYLGVRIIQSAIDTIRELPSVTQKSGKWIEKEGWDGDVYYECSVCGEPFCLIEGTPTDNMYNFCPNCGARMESEE